MYFNHCTLNIEYKYLLISNFKRDENYYRKFYSIIHKLNLNIHEEEIKYF